MSLKPSIVIIGAGNLAYHFSKAFMQLQTVEVCIYNRRQTPLLKRIQHELKVKTLTQLKQFPKTATLYLICVSDAAIASTVKTLAPLIERGVLCHCSGSTPIEVLKTHKLPHGVLYPLQSFSAKRALNWSTIPLLIEGNSISTTRFLKKVAQWLSPTVHVTNSENRLQFHLAAVLVNNFVNALYLAASQQLGSAKAFQLLQPLALETVKKAFELNPVLSQTGPAKRGDALTIKRHLQVLKSSKSTWQLYKSMSAYIEHQFPQPQ